LVIAKKTTKDVRAWTTVDSVIAEPPLKQGISPPTTADEVVACTTIDGVDASTALDYIASIRSIDRVIAGVAHNRGPVMVTHDWPGRHRL
jgi:hypothetical protein